MSETKYCKKCGNKLEANDTGDLCNWCKRKEIVKDDMEIER